MQRNAPTGFAATAFLSRTYDEALGLVYRARDYLVFMERGTRHRLEPVVGLAYAMETTRLTSRLTALMAWLLLQRAVHEGEITAREACREAPYLARMRGCLEGPCIDPPRLPAGLRGLLEESDRLYRRVVRLDDMVRRDLEGGG